MSKYLVAYLATLLSILLMEAVWLGALMPGYYRSELGALLSDQPKAIPAIVFYLLYPLGIVIFVVAPALAAHSRARASLLGALFGLFAYMTYDLSNLSTLKGWPVGVTLVDLGWGVSLTCVTGTVGYLAGAYLSNRPLRG